jgi:hypothetical protein
MPGDINTITKSCVIPPKTIPLDRYFFPQALIPYLPTAILEENLLRVSELYDNITLSHLSEILGVKRDELLEKITPLFVNGAVPGKINLVDNVINFKTGLFLFTIHILLSYRCGVGGRMD